jgi:hypothetical protein
MHETKTFRYLINFARLMLFSSGTALVWLGALGHLPNSQWRIDALPWRGLSALVGVALLSGAPLFRRGGSGGGPLPAADDPQKDPADEHEVEPRLWESPQMFFIPLLIALFIEFTILPQYPESKYPYSRQVEHITVALMVASILGLTYEYILSRRRERALRKILSKHHRLFKKQANKLRERFEELLRLQRATTPELILRMLRDIAAQIKQIPTLYEPARDKANEYTFSANLEYFESLKDSRREEFCSTVREWILDNSCPPNVRFLASDFVGRFELHELRDLLWQKADAQRSHWDSIQDDDKCWILNYMWAASRCDQARYRRLGEFLCSDADEFAQRWILFIPLQLPEPELVTVIGEYLRSRTEISEANLSNVIKAIAAIKRAGVDDATRVITSSLHRFKSEALRQEIEQRLGLELPQPGE